MEGKVVIFSAPSGAGKTTLVKHVISSGLNLEFSVSATTRKQRDGEVDGQDYYFLSMNEFLEKIQNDAFIEWEEVYKGYYYGTLKDEIERIWSKSRHVLFEVDITGGLNLKRIFKDRSLAIFVLPPSISELEDRLRKRGSESPEWIKERIEKARSEIKYKDQFDKVIINNDLNRAKKEALEEVSAFLTQGP